MMLEPRWREVADRIDEWLSEVDYCGEWNCG
jgi:hypothetical protein